MVPIAPGAVPLLGHTPALLRGRWDFVSSLRAHGPIVRIRVGPKELYVLNDPALVRCVLVEHADSIERDGFFKQARLHIGDGLAASDGPLHRSQRRILQPAFQRSRIGGYVELIRRRAEQASAQWLPGSALALDREMSELGLDTLGRLIFGENPAADAAVAEVRRSLPVFIQEVFTRTALPEWARQLPTPGNRRFAETGRRLRAAIASAVDAGAGTGLLGEFARMDMSPELVRDEVVSMLIAGNDNTNATLSWVFHEIGRHESVRKRLHAELDEVLAGGPVTAENIGDLVYTRCVVDETLRLYAPWLVVRRANRDVDVMGHHIPSGGDVLYSHHALHRDPGLFPEPERFDPDRWAEPGYRGHVRGVYMPFGAGVHRCIGEHLFLAQIVTTVATVSARWQLLPAPGKPSRPRTSALPRPGHLPVTAVRRRT
ncbi:cytochrome P450 [Embleya scabrispora]|uniref:cytochrome P450 n=1 Tax=Embleya scabrispora TaxID=159449 RepID=UPI00036A516A|nr:cytochrome P450 [Embleya scabrispora]MYS84188.1 cytochrome P450 [Streptomyces sp. SID5474]